MKSIYLVRHGEAENNTRSGETYKAEDSALTEKGVRQAEIIAERAHRISVDVLISSPFLRTKQTAEIVSRRINVPVEYNELFIERQTPTSFKGTLWTDERVNKLIPEWDRSFGDASIRIEDGDNFTTVSDRALKAMQYLETRPESNILIISHGFFIRVLIAKILFGKDLTDKIFEPFIEGARSTNTGLSIVKYDPQDESRPWWLSVWNDHAHLG